ncbi:MAG: hypothetical protein LBD65_06805, partial [Spirochaetaceae bacterium]|nr:hypothetical protein [Spirochaetaceae bacterium]
KVSSLASGSEISEIISSTGSDPLGSSTSWAFILKGKRIIQKTIRKILRHVFRNRINNPVQRKCNSHPSFNKTFFMGMVNIFLSSGRINAEEFLTTKL